MKKSLTYIYSLLVIVVSATIVALPRSTVSATTTTTVTTHHQNSIDSISESSISHGLKFAQEMHYEFMLKAEEARERLEAEKAAAAKQEAEEAKKSDENEGFYWDGEVITPSSGVANGPSGFETYYNLPMGGVVDIMRNLGYSEEEYPYWVRDDGAKMLGDYIMVAANLDVRPYGTILPCSIGMAIVCDTGSFAVSNPYQLDIAVTW